MARAIRHGSPNFVDPLVTYVLEPNDVIVDRNKLTELFHAAGIQMADLLIDELNTQPK